MAETKKETVKAAAKAPIAKAVAKAPAKKAPATKSTVKKPATKAPAKKVSIKEKVNFEFAGKSYTSEDLINICKDVWKYDLNGKSADLESIELYVKPEENLTYYVINGEIQGSFSI